MFKLISRVFDRPELWLVRCVLVASIIAVVYYSGDKAKDLPTQAMLVFIGLAAVGFHYWGAQKACKAWFERQAGTFAMRTLIVLAAIAWEVNSQMGIASNNQGNLTNAALSEADANTNAAQALTAAQAKVGFERNALEAARKELWDAQPRIGQTVITSPEQAEAAIQRIRGDRLFAATSGCTEKISGPKTRALCAEHAEALQAKSKVANRAQLEGTVKAREEALASAEAALAKAQSERKSVRVVASAERADVRNLKRLTGLDGEDLELSQSLLMVLVMAAFLTLSGWLIKAEEYEGKALRPWINWRRLWASVTGEPYVPGPGVIHRETVIDPAIARRWAENPQIARLAT